MYTQVALHQFYDSMGHEPTIPQSLVVYINGHKI